LTRPFGEIASTAIAPGREVRLPSLRVDSRPSFPAPQLFQLGGIQVDDRSATTSSVLEPASGTNLFFPLPSCSDDSRPVLCRLAHIPFPFQGWWRGPPWPRGSVQFIQVRGYSSLFLFLVFPLPGQMLAGHGEWSIKEPGAVLALGEHPAGIRIFFFFFRIRSRRGVWS